MSELALALQLINTLLPGGIKLFQDLKALFAKYPPLTPEQAATLIVMVTGTAESTYDSVIAEIKADQAAHPTP
jgi:hypothetical protein